MSKQPDNLPVLVTGGAGYIGSHVCKKLKEQGFLPITFDNLSTGHPYSVKWGPLFEGDLLDLAKLREVFFRYQPQAVLHFAANALVIESLSNPEKYYQNNVSGTLNLLKVMRETNVSSIVFSSSCSVYGTPNSTPIKEDHPTFPIHPYGRSKLMIEQILQDYSKAYNLNSLSLRYFNAAGADLSGEIGEHHLHETHLIPLVIQAALGLHPKINVFGNDFPTSDGSAIRDYIHIEDLAEAHLLGLKWLMKNKKNLILNLGTGKGFSVLEVIQAVEDHTKQKIKTQIAPKRQGEPPIQIADSQKAIKYLGWRPKVSNLSTIIESSCKWHSCLSNEIC